MAARPNSSSGNKRKAPLAENGASVGVGGSSNSKRSKLSSASPLPAAAANVIKKEEVVLSENSDLDQADSRMEADESETEEKEDLSSYPVQEEHQDYPSLEEFTPDYVRLLQVISQPGTEPKNFNFSFLRKSLLDQLGKLS